MKTIMICGAIAAAALVAGCTDVERAHWGALGSEGRVTCYSGGRLIYDDFSTGKIQNAQGSDGYEFKSITTQRLSQVSGDCIVDYGAVKPAGWTATLAEATPAQ